MSRNPFDYVTSINTKQYIMNDSGTVRGYNPFMVNRAFSYFQDTVLYAQEMNLRPELGPKAQYDFLFYSIRARKRFSKWYKPDPVSEDVDLIMNIYKYSRQKAVEALAVLTPEQLQELRRITDTGGVK